MLDLLCACASGAMLAFASVEATAYLASPGEPLLGTEKQSLMLFGTMLFPVAAIALLGVLSLTIALWKTVRLRVAAWFVCFIAGWIDWPFVQTWAPGTREHWALLVVAALVVSVLVAVIWTIRPVRAAQ